VIGVLWIHGSQRKENHERFGSEGRRSNRRQGGRISRSIGVRFVVDGSEADDRFSLVEHPMSARALAAPLHRHTNEDEYSFVLEGAWERCWATRHIEAGPGDLVHAARR
jgi:mannose-6-phosphate isomerase-like protein (cupin superfamily)